jgi:DnaJ-domain-containing protein 1
MAGDKQRAKKEMCAAVPGEKGERPNVLRLIFTISLLLMSSPHIAGGNARAAEGHHMRQGMTLYANEEYSKATDAFLKALEEIKVNYKAGTREKKKVLEDIVKAQLAKSLFAEGLFDPMEQLVSTMQSPSKATAEMVKKAQRYRSITILTDAEVVDAALKECKASQRLLEIRIAKRMQSGDYTGAQYDLLVLERHHGKSEKTKQFSAQLCFLQRSYARGLALLEELPEHREQADAFKRLLEQYRRAGESGKDMKIYLLSAIEKKISLESKPQDMMCPSIFTEFHYQVLEELSVLCLNSGMNKETLHYSQRTIKAKRDLATPRDYIVYATCLIRNKMFQEAEDVIVRNFKKNSVEYKKMVDMLKSAYEREKARKEEEERRQEEERKVQEEKREMQERERKRRERDRRERTVAGRRRSDPDPEGFYKLLGVPVKSSAQNVNSAYKKLVRKYNPGKMRQKGEQEQKHAREMLVRANKAKEVLTDADKKDEYDGGRYMTEKEKKDWGYVENQGFTDYEGHGESLSQEILEMLFKQQGHGDFSFQDFVGKGGRGRTRKIYFI